MIKICDYFGIFPSRCLPISTIKTMPVMIGEKIYPRYQVIDLSMSQEKVSTQFIDTVTMSNLLLESLGKKYPISADLKLF